MSIPIFCINLERAIERQQRIKEEWIDSLGLEILFWKAYDRRDIQKGKYKYKYNPDKTKSFLKRNLSLGEIACITSYCMLYEHCLKEQYKEIIVMEDDVSPLIKDKKDLYNIINNGKHEFPESEFMMLHEFDRFTNKNSIPIIQKEYFSTYNLLPWGNLLLYMNNQAIQKIYNFLIHFICCADHPQRFLSSKNLLHTIVTNYPICRHNSIFTYIGNDLRFSEKRREFIE